MEGLTMAEIVEFPDELEEYGVEVEKKEVIIEVPSLVGVTDEEYLRMFAKSYLRKKYFQKIKTKAVGHTEKNGKIFINIVGGWLFGVPGYRGRLTIKEFKDNKVTLQFPVESPEIIHQFIDELKQKIEAKLLKNNQKH
ncbi:hypothetical protein KAR26_02980 [Candidatus Parcubacteria bacterium]|nr:hypothetical protein [Candidatus Parcubacteria bacterium]